MSGLNYGYKYRYRPKWYKKEGVIYNQFQNDWLVRVYFNPHKALRSIKTLSRHATKEDAEAAYEAYYLNEYKGKR